MTEADSIARLRADLHARGENPDTVGWADDRDLPRIDGVQLVRRVDGVVQVTTWERGEEFDLRRYPNESQAAADLRGRLDRHRRLSAPIGESQAQIWSRMQHQAQQELDRLTQAEPLRPRPRLEP